VARTGSHVAPVAAAVPVAAAIRTPTRAWKFKIDEHGDLVCSFTWNDGVEEFMPYEDVMHYDAVDRG
jgi:hypothetical protein